MLDLVTVSPIQWGEFEQQIDKVYFLFNSLSPDVKINQKSIAPQSEITVACSAKLTIDITISNNQATTLHNLVLSVQFYQDFQNGIQNYRLETRTCSSGPNQWVRLLIINILCIWKLKGKRLSGESDRLDLEIAWQLHSTFYCNHFFFIYIALWFRRWAKTKRLHTSSRRYSSRVGVSKLISTARANRNLDNCHHHHHLFCPKLITILITSTNLFLQ